MVTIQIYEDNAALRHGLEQLLSFSGEFAITGSYDNCLQAEAQVTESAPDVILMDIDMPGMTGIEAVKKIRAINTKVQILMLTVFDDNTHILEAICAGASGYMLKKNVSEKLIPAINELLAEGVTLSASVAKMIITSMQQPTTRQQYDFTNREQEILALLCKGNSYKMIAAELGIAFETVRSYIKKIYEKLQVHSATEAVSKAINEKLI